MSLLLKSLDDLERDFFSPFYEVGNGMGIDAFHRSANPTNGWVPDWTDWLRLADLKKEKASKFGKDGFQVSMDVTQFKPSELTVKVVDNCITVEGKHEEREDHHGHISRHFVRRYTLPKDYDPEKVASTLSSDGVLTIRAPKPQAIEDKSKERIIQIQQTGPAHLNVKQNSSGEPIKGGD